MTGGWLWDKKISDAAARKILKQPEDRKFAAIAAILLSRKGNPKEVFASYLEPLTFCRQWNNIKRKMRQDKWSEPRIIYWQAIYERLADKYHKKGIIFRAGTQQVREKLCIAVGGQISSIRKEQNISQKALAEKMNISQQLISRVEKGGENISLTTLVNIARALGMRVKINFEEGTK